MRSENYKTQKIDLRNDYLDFLKPDFLRQNPYFGQFENWFKLLSYVKLLHYIKNTERSLLIKMRKR